MRIATSGKKLVQRERVGTRLLRMTTTRTNKYGPIDNADAKREAQSRREEFGEPYTCRDRECRERETSGKRCPWCWGGFPTSSAALSVRTQADYMSYMPGGSATD